MSSKNTSKTAGKRPGGRPGTARQAGKPAGRPAGGGSAKQRAKAAKAVAAARADRARRNRIIITASVCAALLVIVIGAVSFAMYEANKPKTIPAKTIAAHYPVKIDNGTVLAGKSTAKVKIDIYEDFMCPFCGQLEQNYGSQMQKDLNNGTLQIRYRIVDTLNQNSTPPGYSQRAANAAIATVKYGKFASYHWDLYHNQPQERGPGYSNKQLIDLGHRLGISNPAFDKAVNSGKYNKFPDTQAQKLASDKSLHQPDGSYGTPTVVHNGKTIDSTKSGWLTSLVNNAG